MSTVTHRLWGPPTLFHAHGWAPDSRTLQLGLQIGTFTAPAKGGTRLPPLYRGVSCLTKLVSLSSNRQLAEYASEGTLPQRAPTAPRRQAIALFLMSFPSLPDKVSSRPYRPLCLGQSQLTKPALGCLQSSSELCGTPPAPIPIPQCYNRCFHLPFLEGIIARNNWLGGVKWKCISATWFSHPPLLSSWFLICRTAVSGRHLPLP